MSESSIMNKLLLVNTSNLHTGGGVQVAISFLYELSLLDSDLSNIHVVASSEVADGLMRLQTNVLNFGKYDILDTFGLKALYSNLNNRIKNYDVVFTVFGPNYLRCKAEKEIVGFAQPWILNFKNPISENMSFFNRSKLRIRFHLQWLFFFRSDDYIVELEHVKEALILLKNIDGSKINVVYNTVSSLYKDKSKWESVLIKKNSEDFSLGIVTRDYPHKNLAVLPLVAEALDVQHNLKVHFYTTLNDLEWDTKDEYFKRYVSTVGSLSPDECPSFYEQIDGVIFPSLLECFSATPLEAMVMEKPLFASDRGFVRDVCGNNAVYFDPVDPNDIANKIADYLKSDIDYSYELKQAKMHALNFSNAKGRAEGYLKIIHEHL